MGLSIKSLSSFIGALIFLGIAVYSSVEYGFNTRAIMAYVITLYFLVAAFLGVRSQITMLVRVVLVSLILIYVISIYVG